MCKTYGGTFILEVRTVKGDIEDHRLTNRGSLILYWSKSLPDYLQINYHQPVEMPMIVQVLKLLLFCQGYVNLINYLNMHNSFQGPELRIWHRPASQLGTSEEDLDTCTEQDYLQKFQKNNEVFALRSQLNQAHLALQKISIQQQESAIEERDFYQKIEEQKRKIEQRQAELQEQVKKNMLIAEAERNAKASYSHQFKVSKQQLYLIKKALDISEESSSEAIIKSIGALRQKVKDLEDQCLGSKTEMETLKMMNETNLKKLKEEKQLSIEALSSLHEGKLKKHQEQEQLLQSQCWTKDKLLEEVTAKLALLESADLKVKELAEKLEEQLKNNLANEEKLVALRVKEELLAITKQKWQEEKMRFNEQTEDIKFKLSLTSKKLEAAEKNLKTESQKSHKLEEMNHELKLKLKNSEEIRIQLQESVGAFKQKVKICQIYKEKYKNAHTQLQKRGSNIEEYENTISELQIQIRSFADQLNFFQGEKMRFEEVYSDLSKELQQKEKEITKLTITSAHQAELIKQCRTEITRCRIELEDSRKEATRKKSIVSVANQSLNESAGPIDREQFQRMSEDIINHYLNILEAEDSNRKQLQGQMQKSDEMALQLRGQLSQLQRELAETAQQNRLIRQQNERLIKSIATLQNNHEKRIEELKERFKQIQRSKQYKPLQSLKLNRTMRITNCFSINENSTCVADKKKEVSSGREELVMVKFHTEEGQRQKQEPDGFQNRYSAGNLLSYPKPSLSPKSSQLDKVINNYKESNRNIKVKLNL